MRLRSLFFASTVLAGACPAALQAQTTAPSAEPQVAEGSATPSGDIVVTARKRAETLVDVPIAATALTGETLAARGINSVREAAALTPGLNINSDGAGRAFVSIRGVGVTLVATVQPGVGLFIDGIYQPNTSYLNNPLVDVDRIEVLRGPQGTLYGKNTMGGAINVITRVPGNDFHVRGSASYAGPDNAWSVSAAAEGAIVPDKIQVRVAAAHRQQEGFIRNVTPGVGGNANPFNSDSVNGTIRFLPAEDVIFTVKGYYDWVDGANTPYSRVTGPTNYSRNNEYNVVPRVSFRYRGINARLDVPVGEPTTVSLIGSYDLRDGRTRQADVDFGPADIARATGNDKLRTKTVELRANSEWSDQFSSLFGLFYSRETLSGLDNTTIIPANNLLRRTIDRRRGDTYAAFGTLFWKPTTDWEVSLGLRYDHESRRQMGQITVGPVAAPATQNRLKTDQLQPKLSVTRHFENGLMAYASVARGYRGGGFNAPTAPAAVRTYKGDHVWTYEVGSKFVSDDRRFSLSGAVFYNDYKDYIGLNSIAMATGGGLVTVDLNAGDVESYGIELETRLKPTEQWTITGGLTLMHARLQNFDAYTAVTNRRLSSDRLTFQPDVTGNIYSDYEIPVGEDSLVLTGGMTYKGKRLAATLNQNTPTLLKGYALVNLSVTFRHGPFELGVFANNLLNKDYFESYIEKTTLQLAGVPAGFDLGIIGDRRRYGVRGSFKF